MLGVRVGRAIGAAQLTPPTPVKPIFVERCADCADRIAAEDAGITAADVEETLRQQGEVEHATD